MSTVWYTSPYHVGEPVQTLDQAINHSFHRLEIDGKWYRRIWVIGALFLSYREGLLFPSTSDSPLFLAEV